MKVTENMAKVAEKIEGLCFIALLIVAGLSNDPKIWQVIATILILLVYEVASAVERCYKDDLYDLED